MAIIGFQVVRDPIRRAAIISNGNFSIESGATKILQYPLTIWHPWLERTYLTLSWSLFQGLISNGPNISNLILTILTRSLPKLFKQLIFKRNYLIIILNHDDHSSSKPYTHCLSWVKALTHTQHPQCFGQEF